MNLVLNKKQIITTYPSLIKKPPVKQMALSLNVKQTIIISS